MYSENSALLFPRYNLPPSTMPGELIKSIIIISYLRLLLLLGTLITIKFLREKKLFIYYLFLKKPFMYKYKLLFRFTP